MRSDPRGRGSDDLLKLDAAKEARLRVYLDLVLQWTERIDLIAPLDRDQAWYRHILDSLQLLPLLPPFRGQIVDLGSGAGFPGLVLAIATGAPTRLVEADQRKAAFLREAIRITQAPAEVLPVRAELLPPQAAPVVTARALAPLKRLLPLVKRHLAPGGIALLPKGAGWQHELRDAAIPESVVVDPVPSRTEPAAMILRIQGLADG